MNGGAYQPWNPEKFPRLRREIVAVTWTGSGELRIEITEGSADVPSLILTFPHTRAYQGIDEGLRLLDSPDWSSVRALIYSSRSSPYLARFRENAAGMMDTFPLTHWLVASCNECVDVITVSEPTVVAIEQEHGVPAIHRRAVPIQRRPAESRQDAHNEEEGHDGE
jgi:hypothetical protein